MKTKKASTGSESPLLQLKITLRHSNPPIWRRVVVPASITLERLHRVIQAAMPWTNSHLHQFIHGKDRFVMSPQSEREFSFGPLPYGEKKAYLWDVCGRGGKIIYEYDFGDGWDHEVEIEKELPTDPTFGHPTCLAGENACPPDDCGGIPGYYEMLEVLADPQHEEHESMKEWIGGEWDPARFDLEDANRRLRRIKV